LATKNGFCSAVRRPRLTGTDDTASDTRRSRAGGNPEETSTKLTHLH